MMLIANTQFRVKHTICTREQPFHFQISVFDSFCGKVLSLARTAFILMYGNESMYDRLYIAYTVLFSL